MYWLDIAAVSIVLVFGILGFSGWLNRLRGLLFGIILGVVIIGMTPFVLSNMIQVSVSILKNQTL